MTSTTTVMLVRHGQVRNPNHVVYGHLPGFEIDSIGVQEAHTAGLYLRDHQLSAIVTSPLIRAVRTATAIARHHDLDLITDDRLVEWNVSPIWLGQGWDDIHRIAPGEVEAYLAHPHDLDYAFETLQDVVARTTASVTDHLVPGGTTVFVSHQDPVSATALALTGAPLNTLLDAPPPHASVTTLERHGDSPWKLKGRWTPTER